MNFRFVLMFLAASHSTAFQRLLVNRIPFTITLSAFTMSTAEATSSSTTSSAYKQLVSKLQTITHLERAKAVLSYDQLVFMPAAASSERGAQMSALAAVIHQQRTDPQLKELLQQAASASNNDNDAARLLELETQAMEENERIPAELAAKQAALEAAAYQKWVEAKNANNGAGDFAQFADTLQECFNMAMEVAAAKRGDKNISLYTQMLDEFEMGMPQERIDEIFGEIQAALVPLIEKVLASEHKPSTKPLKGNFDIKKQQEVATKIVETLGYDITAGRMDVSVHPFSTSFSSKDVRITSRYRTDEWYQGLAAVIHEGGHAMYEQNIGDSALMIDTALSMGTHESQSLFWERHVGMSRPFWKWALPAFKAQFPDEFANVDHESVHDAVNAVHPSLIRVEADELTYPLHVILRYQIEKDVIAGDLKVQDIPTRWNADMKKLLQVDVPNDANGCLQDVHWASLAIGYFPTYLIGSATAAQLAHYCAQDLPMAELCEKGEFGAIKAWMTDKVHRHGKRYKSLDTMLEDMVGEKLNPKYFLDYLTQKYTDLYKL